MIKMNGLSKNMNSQIIVRQILPVVVLALASVASLIFNAFSVFQFSPALPASYM
jgi:uncharacterized membrane protein